MASVASAFLRIKENLRSFLPDHAVEAAARKAGHRWRRRQFGPVETIRLIQFFLSVPICASSSLSLRLMPQSRRPSVVLGISHHAGTCSVEELFRALFDRNRTKSRRFRYIFEHFPHVFRRMFGQNPRF